MITLLEAQEVLENSFKEILKRNKNQPIAFEKNALSPMAETLLDPSVAYGIYSRGNLVWFGEKSYFMAESSEMSDDFVAREIVAIAILEEEAFDANIAKLMYKRPNTLMYADGFGNIMFTNKNNLSKDLDIVIRRKLEQERVLCNFERDMSNKVMYGQEIVEAVYCGIEKVLGEE